MDGVPVAAFVLAGALLASHTRPVPQRIARLPLAPTITRSWDIGGLAGRAGLEQGGGQHGSVLMVAMARQG